MPKKGKRNDMGNLLSLYGKQKSSSISRSPNSHRSSSRSGNPGFVRRSSSSSSRADWHGSAAAMSKEQSMRTSSNTGKSITKNKYAFIPDNYTTLSQVLLSFAHF